MCRDWLVVRRTLGWIGAGGASFGEADRGGGGIILSVRKLIWAGGVGGNLGLAEEPSGRLMVELLEAGDVARDASDSTSCSDRDCHPLLTLTMA